MVKSIKLSIFGSEVAADVGDRGNQQDRQHDAPAKHEHAFGTPTPTAGIAIKSVLRRVITNTPSTR